MSTDFNFRLIARIIGSLLFIESVLLLAMSFIPLICIIYYINTNLFASGLLFGTLFGLVFILAPLIYFTIKIWLATKSEDFHHLSTVLKWILFFGILSIVVISLNIKYNA